MTSQSFFEFYANSPHSKTESSAILVSIEDPKGAIKSFQIKQMKGTISFPVEEGNYKEDTSFRRKTSNMFLT